MNAITSHFMKRTIVTLAFGVCVMFIAAPDARAHAIDFRPAFVEVHYGHAGARHFPGWLRRKHGFQHWYWHSGYRFKRHLNWHRLYHIYLDDRRHYRHARRLHRHHHADHGYRAHNKKHRRHNH
jgi:hypothetical protein